MFTFIMTLIAACLLVNCNKNYRAIAVILFLEFALHKLVYWFFWPDIRVDNGWFIFMCYAFIQVVTLGALYYFKAHAFITILVLINMIYNIFTAFGWFYEIFKSFYYAKDVIVGIIMILELIYMGLINGILPKLLSRLGFNCSDYLDRIYRSRANFLLRSNL